MDEREPERSGRAIPPWLRGRAARWGGGVVVAALLVGGGAAALAEHDGHGGHGGHAGRADARDEEHGGRTHGRGGRDGRSEEHDRHTRQNGGNAKQGKSGGRTRTAPAPLPALDAAEALAKAAATVPNGRVESLETATATDGGRAWRAVVIGPDGVRHLVTLDGTTGTPTGNTVLD
ncbi:MULTISPECIES: hypothetical protein [Kitasatospora]|uniref:hypothetical protein n=1 Tax=Kitasatospora TaxID=2063 RepID=UPI00030CB94F|nr:MULTISPECIES: hypothetical protein [Kitasatospora]